MEFRIRGNVLQLIRTGEDAATGRAKRELVGRVPKDLDKLPAEIARKMTAAELAEFENFTVQAAMAESLRGRLAAHEIDASAAVAGAYLSACTDENELVVLRMRAAEAVALLQAALQGPRRRARAEAPDAS